MHAVFAGLAAGYRPNGLGNSDIAPRVGGCARRRSVTSAVVAQKNRGALAAINPFRSDRLGGPSTRHDAGRRGEAFLLAALKGRSQQVARVILDGLLRWSIENVDLETS
jgi:hypothetical protein